MRPDEEKTVSENRVADDDWSVDEVGDPSPPQSFLDDRIGRLSASQMHSAALLCEALLAGVACVGLVLSSYDRSQGPFELSDCQQLGDRAARLVCFDRLANSASFPFKGGSPYRMINHPEP